MKESELSQSLSEYLPGIIEDTRLSRIEAERRLVENDKLAKHATVYYACLTTVLTLLTFSSGAPYLPFLSVASSVTLTLATIYATSQDYQSKAQEMKRCYLELQALSFRIDNVMTASQDDCEDEIFKIGKLYSEILARCDNHLPKDFAKVERRREGKKQNGIVARKQPSKVGFRAAGYYLVRAAVYIGPYALFGTLAFLFWVI